MENAKEEIIEEEEEDCKPLTDEEFAEFQKEEAAQKVFGRGWKELIPIFTAGQEKYNSLLEEQEVLTNDQVNALGKADDAFKQIQQQVELMEQGEHILVEELK